MSLFLQIIQFLRRDNWVKFKYHLFILFYEENLAGENFNLPEITWKMKTV